MNDTTDKEELVNEEARKRNAENQGGVEAEQADTEVETEAENKTKIDGE